MEKYNKPGRPATGRKRTVNMTIAFSPEEKAQLREIALENGLSVADWIMGQIKKEKNLQ